MLNQKFQKQYTYQQGTSRFRAFVRRILYSIKNRYLTEPTFFLNRNPAYKNWQIGDYTYGSLSGSPHIVHYGENVQLTIGKFCSIADNVKIFLGGNHRIDWVSTYPFNVIFEAGENIKGHPQSAGDIVIGNDVWIGEAAMILSGIKIGNGAVVAAGALVTKDIPAYCIAGGNPAKIIRQRFSDDIIAKLESIAWWNWDISKINDNIPLILQNDIDVFISKHFPDH
jgi:acetyltransferase-like isoleucine patch superfamily enzyme